MKPLSRSEQRVEDQIDQVTAQVRELLSGLASTDPLTGLRNRQGLRSDLGKAEGQPVGLAFVEINGFKNLNTAYTHEGGDEILEEVGTRLGQFASEQDNVSLTAYHVSGDEFHVLSRGIMPDQLLPFLHDLKAVLESEIYTIVSQQTTTQPGEVSFTIGLSFRDVYDDPRDYSAMLAEVDTLVEYLKFQRSTGQAVPEVANYAGLQDELEAFRAAERAKVRRRFYCPGCGTYGVLHSQQDFSGCPQCGLKPFSLP
jgi:diguanylate cyclase (GGDEF)-like protein